MSLFINNKASNDSNPVSGPTLETWGIAIQKSNYKHFQEQNIAATCKNIKKEWIYNWSIAANHTFSLWWMI